MNGIRVPLSAGCLLLLLETFVDAQAGPPSQIAFVAGISGPPNGLQIQHSGQSQITRPGYVLFEGDGVQLTSGSSLTLIFIDGTVESMRGPRQWRAMPMRPKLEANPALSARLLAWFKAREKLCLRVAGARQSLPMPARLGLICAQLDLPDPSSEKASCSLVWACPEALRSRLHVVLGRGKDRLQEVPLEGKALREYGDLGVCLYTATVPLRWESSWGDAELRLIDPGARIDGASNPLPVLSALVASSLSAAAQSPEPPGADESSARLAMAIVHDNQGLAVTALRSYVALLATQAKEPAVHQALATFFEEHGAVALANWHINVADSP